MSFFNKLFISGSSARSDVHKLESYVADLAHDSTVTSQAKRNGLSVQTVVWEDTGRYKGSWVGPNISDMTLKLSTAGGHSGQNLPIIRYPNFEDKTCDTPIEKFMVTVGNETANSDLENIGQYVKTSSGQPIESLYCAEKDSQILTSAQYCILPLSEGTTPFNVSLYNYQSSSDDPAILVLVGSQKGTSTQAVFGGMTPLYFNNAGGACDYVAERLKDERKRLGKSIEGKMDQDEQEQNALIIFQIPLQVKERPRRDIFYEFYIPESSSGGLPGCSSGGLPGCSSGGLPGCSSVAYDCNESLECCDEAESSSWFEKDTVTRSLESSKKTRGMDHAMISVGQVHSPFVGIKDYQIKRDTRFPIRATIQLYQVTDKREVVDEMWVEMNTKLGSIYRKGEAVGSLVTELETGRKTEWDPLGSHKSTKFTKTLPASEASKSMFANF
jgi:hypothetical protein